MGFLQDLQFAFRISAKRPAATLAIVVILGLGIGVNVAVFSLVNAALLKPLPIHQPQRVLALYVGVEGDADPYGGSAYPDFVDLREHASDLIDLCAISEGLAINLGSADGAVRIDGGLVSGNYFSMLGVGAFKGRVLHETDDLVRGGHSVVVISHRLWRTQFGGDEAIVGREVMLNGHPFEVVGVAEEGFDGTRQNQLVAAWGTMSMFDELNPQMAQWFSSFGDMLEMRSVSWLEVIGRLRDDATIEQVRQSINAGYQVIAETEPNRASYRCTALPIGQTTIEPSRRGGMSMWLQLLLMAVGVLMLIACSNVASLQLARLHGRRRELAMRRALGAGRWRLARQLLTESLLLAGVGAATGLMVAQWLGGTFAVMLSQEGTFSAEALRMDLDWRIVAFTIGMALVATVLFGMGPALLAVRSDPLPALKIDRAGGRAAGRGWSLQNLLVSGQVALSFVLVISASLLVVSLVRLQRVQLGFNPHQVLVSSIDFSRQGIDESAGRLAYDTIVRRLSVAPGVVDVALATHVPVSGAVWSSNINIPDYEAIEGEEPGINFNNVDANYFTTMQIPLLNGRVFEPTDGPDSPKVAVINQTMAQRYWPGVDPVGRTFAFGSESEDPVTVIGVVGDNKYNTFRAESIEYAYFPLAQRYQSGISIVVRTSGDSFSAVSALRDAVSAVDPGLPVFKIRSLDQQLRDVLARDRLTATLFGGFGGAALLLVLAGLYGVLSYTVTQRVREIGIRIAIGAKRKDVMRQFLWRGVRITGVGLAIGALASLFVTRLLSHQLFEIEPADPLVMAGVALVLIVVGVIACWIPARRATRIDPMIALRSE